MKNVRQFERKELIEMNAKQLYNIKNSAWDYYKLVKAILEFKGSE